MPTLDSPLHLGAAILIFFTFAILLARCRNRFLPPGKANPGPDTPLQPDAADERRKRGAAQNEWLEAFDILGTAAFAYDQSYRIVGANRTYAEHAGLPLEDIIGHPYFDIYPKQARPIIDDRVKDGVSETEVRLPTGETFFSKSFPVHDENRQYRYSMHVLEDMTAQRSLEHSVQRSRMMLKMASICMRDMGLAENAAQMLQTACRNAVQNGGFRIAWAGYEARGGRLSIQARYGQRAPLPDEISLQDTLGISLDALKAGKTVIAQNLLNVPAYDVWRKDALRQAYSSMAVFPLADQHGIYGVLCLGAAEPYAFIEEEIGVLEMLVASLALGLASFRIRDELNDRQRQRLLYLEPLNEHLEDVIETVASVLEARINPYATGHLKRVAALAMAIGLEMGQPLARARGLHLAGLLHDIGEAAAPEALFLKNTPLTEDEQVLIRLHPQAGYERLKHIDFPWPVAEMVLQHHERLDGSGYPRGLRGDEILMEAKILAVADTIEALAFGQRPNHPRLGIAAALSEVEKQKGKLYDGAIVEAALTLFREKGLVIS